MAVSRALRRLLRIRELEQEQSRLALESTLGELIQLQKALTTAAESARRGRRLVSASVLTGELSDRLAGLEETRAALRHATALSDRVESVEDEVEGLRRRFLARRVERRQAETLIRETEMRDSIKAGRSNQQALDDWYGSRMFRAHAEGTRAKKSMSISATLQSEIHQGESDASETLEGIRPQDCASSGIRKDRPNS